jgi:hypothetical protein
MTTPPQQAIWDATVEAVAGHRERPCNSAAKLCPHMQGLATALSAAFDNQSSEDALANLRWLVTRLHEVNCDNSRTASEDAGRPAVSMSALNIAETGGLLAALLYISHAQGDTELDDAATLIIRTLGEASVNRAVAAIMPTLLHATATRHQQMAAPIRSTR